MPLLPKMPLPPIIFEPPPPTPSGPFVVAPVKCMMVKFNVKIASIRTPRAEYCMCAIGQGKQHQGGGETGGEN
jgi:hypothetical protein